jgi:hypothetical protein
VADILKRYRRKDRITADDLLQATREELLSLRILIQRSIDSIKLQMEDAEVARGKQGTMYNQDWFNRARIVRRRLGRLSQDVQHEIGRRNDQTEDTNRHQTTDTNRHQTAYVNSFLKAMEVVLTPEQREKVIAMARDLRMQWEAEGPNPSQV